MKILGKVGMFAGVAALFLMAGCDWTVSPSAPTKGYVRFVNTVNLVIPGGSVNYTARALSGLGQTWSAEIPYGSQSVIMEVTPHSGSFTVTGEIRPSSGGTWTAASWDYTNEIVAGDTVLLTLIY